MCCGPSAWLLLAVVAGCHTSSPASPSAPSAASRTSVSGSWAGSYVAVCPTSATCAVVGIGPLGPQPLALALAQDGEVLSGQINLAGWLPRVATVTGRIAPDGVVTLQGGDTWPGSEWCGPAGGWHIASWNARHDPRTDTISGDFTFVTQKHLSSCYYVQDLVVNALGLSLRRGTMPEAPFGGHWQGTYMLRACTSVGWPSCAPDRVGSIIPFDLHLTQEGSSVTGTLTMVPFSSLIPLAVTGTVTADGLRLTASRTDAVGGGSNTVRLVGWLASTDPVGRMTGRFGYVDEMHWTSGASQGTTYSMTYDAELRHVVRVPW